MQLYVKEAFILMVAMIYIDSSLIAESWTSKELHTLSKRFALINMIMLRLENQHDSRKEARLACSS